MATVCPGSTVSETCSISGRSGTYLNETSSNSTRPRTSAGRTFVTASAAARAQRRALELVQHGEMADYTAILADIIRRDARDSSRPVAPLRSADDAMTLDTTHLGIESASAEALRIIEAARTRV
jgi:cytidylate kinase